MDYGSVVFDLDGVLLDSVESEEWKYEATREALRELGADEDFDRGTLDAVLGDEGYGECVRVCGEIGVDPQRAWNLVAEKTSEARLDLIEEGRFSLVEGVKDTLEELRDAQVKLGVVSNAPDQAVELFVDHYDLRGYFKFFRGVQSFEDLKDNKPDPNHLELARFSLKREPFLYVGDQRSDVEAAKAANMDSVWVDGGEGSPDYRVETVSGVLDVVKD